MICFRIVYVKVFCHLDSTPPRDKRPASGFAQWDFCLIFASPQLSALSFSPPCFYYYFQGQNSDLVSEGKLNEKEPSEIFFLNTSTPPQPASCPGSFASISSLNNQRKPEFDQEKSMLGMKLSEVTHCHKPAKSRSRITIFESQLMSGLH